MVDLQTAHQLLKQFDCLQTNPADCPPKETLQTALQTVASKSDFQIFGVCAGSLGEGVNALKAYAQALDYTLPEDYQLDEIEGAAYIKFNPKAGLIYADAYQGDHRGVLVSCQSAYDGGLNEMYGHLPLDLFM